MKINEQEKKELKFIFTSALEIFISIVVVCGIILLIFKN